MPEIKKHVVVSEVNHKWLKQRAIENGSTIEREINKILTKENQFKKSI